MPLYRVLPFIEALAEWPATNDTVAGMDFGYHDPTVILRVARADGVPRPRLFVWAIFRESLHTTGDVLAKLDSDEYPEITLPKSEVIWADSAESDRIEEIRREGYNIHPVVKGPGSIKAASTGSSATRSTSADRQVGSRAPNSSATATSSAAAASSTNRSTGTTTSPTPFATPHSPIGADPARSTGIRPAF